VVGDLMVFVEVTDEEGPLGLVFKPNKIVDYHGEPLHQLGVVLNANVSSILWNADTLKVLSVTIRDTTESRPMATAG
jgi:hypothetical protein